MSSEFPSPSDIAQSFATHYQYYLDFCGVAVDSAAQSEIAVTRQYAGRVAFELLQNALDRASSRVLLQRDGPNFIVANDGRGVSCNPSFRLNMPISDKNRPSDFQSLCSMHTSNKNPEEDNGNKGVGFRSVFSVASRVYVWSKMQGGEWWGILLLRDLSAESWLSARQEPQVAAGFASYCSDFTTKSPWKIGQRRPSYYFPLPLRSITSPIPDTGWAQTVVVVPCDTSESKDSIRQSIATLKNSHLEFIGLRNKPPISVQIDNDVMLSTALSENVVARWDVCADRGQSQDPLFFQAKNAGLDIRHHIGGAVRWPASRSTSTGRIYCYLATEVPCPFSIDIHADLQTGIDRKHLEVKAEEADGLYNRELLLRGINLHLQQIEMRGWQRDDLWAMLDPGPGMENLLSGDDPVRCLLTLHMRDLLFGGPPTKDPESWRRWASLAARCFDGRPLSARTFSQFWTATEHWINSVCPSGKKEAHFLGLAFLIALREAGAKVVPIVDQCDEELDQLIHESVTPPTAGESNKKNTEKLFHVTPEQRDQFDVLPMPHAISDRGRKVTAWAFPKPFTKDGRLCDSVEYQRVSLLEELRQLPVVVSSFSSESLHQTDAVERQMELIVFAARVFMLKVAAGKGEKAYADEQWAPGWRVDQDEKPSPRHSAGRAIATMFLPNSYGTWEPARQLAQSRIAGSLFLLLEKQVPGLPVDNFLRFLGVYVGPGNIPLVESGDDGVIEPCSLPPALCDADSGHHISPLSVPFRKIGDLSQLASWLDLAWIEGWLAQLAARESQRPHRLNVCKSLGEYPWYPVGNGFALPPNETALVPEAVAPRRLTLLTSTHQRVDDAVWRTRTSAPTVHWLKALGARSLEEQLGDPTTAADVIRGLAATYPDVPSTVGNCPAFRYVLIELFKRALEGVLKNKENALWPGDLPLLVETLDCSNGRRATLQWNHRGDAYVAKERSDREVVRRYASDIDLLVATMGPTQAKGTSLEERTIEVSSTVAIDQELEGPGICELRDLLSSLLPHLLAIAEVSRRYNHQVDAVQVADKWRDMEFHRIHDVWRRLELVGKEFYQEEMERKGKYDDVMYDVDRGQADQIAQSRIYFDVSEDRQEKGLSYPPLTEFAEALAAILLDGTVEPDWRVALGEYEADGLKRLNAYCERINVSEELVESMRAGLAPLDPSLLPGHRDSVERVLAGFGLRLTDDGWNANGALTLVLGRHVEFVSEHAADATEEDVNRALGEADFVDEARRLIPRFAARSVHMGEWVRFADENHRKLRLLRYKFDQIAPNQARPRDRELESGDLAKSLQEHVEFFTGNLRFEPEQVARAWLGGDLPPAPLDEWLPAFNVFAPVKSPPVLAILRKVPVVLRSPSASVAAPFTAEEQNAKNAAKAVKGDYAEQSLLAWVVPETSRVLAGPLGRQAWRALASAYPSTGVVRRRLEQVGPGATEDELRDVLCVSRYWRGSGFDIIGLRVEDGVAVPARYEVKALPDGEDLRLYISANELAVYRATRTPPTAERRDLREGTWDLIGVRKDGKALVLTEALAPLLNPSACGLNILAEEGFSADSFQLVTGIDTQN